MCYYYINTMNTYKKAYLLAFLMIFGLTLMANAAEENTRFFVKSNSVFLKKSLGVKHTFDNGFTTDATEWQLRFTKIFGIIESFLC